MPNTNTRSWPIRGAHGLTLGGYHTFRDWSMIAEEIPVFAMPEPKTNFVEVAGMDGALDYTEVLGNVTYKNRKGSVNFLVLNDTQWQAAYSAIAMATHGKRLNCILDDDPNYFYTGRFAINKWQSERDYSRIVIDYDLDPYKYPIDSTISHDWLWNDLFDTTIYYGTFDVTTSKQRNLINPSGSNVTPTFVCSDDFVVAFNGVNYPLDTGTTSQPGFVLAPGDNYMTFYGTGRVMVDYSIGKSL